MNNIYEKLNEIQTELVVNKSRKNEFGNFKYRNCEDILQAVKPHLKELKYVLLLNDEIVQISDKLFVKATAKLVNAEQKEESITSNAYAELPAKPKAKMDECQMTGSASSYARKYALNELFDLDDNQDSDSMNNEKKDEKLITKEQTDRLKSLGFNEERLNKMAKYYKVKSINKITYKQAEDTIAKQKSHL